MEQDKSRYEGIGGWLWLPMLGMVLSIVLVSRDLFGEFIPLILDGSFKLLTEPSSNSYHPLWVPVLIMEGLGNVLLLILPAITLVLIVRRSSLAPKAAIVWLAIVAVVNLALSYLGNQIPALVENSDYQSDTQAVRSMISAAIWIPYFLVSKRVKATFIR